MKSSSADRPCPIVELKGQFNHLDCVLQQLEKKVRQWDTNKRASVGSEQGVCEMQGKMMEAERSNQLLAKQCELAFDVCNRVSDEKCKLTEANSKQKEQINALRTIITSLNLSLSKKNLANSTLKASNAALREDLKVAKGSNDKTSQDQLMKYEQQIKKLREENAVQRLVVEVSAQMANRQVEELNKELKGASSGAKATVASLNKAAGGEDAIANELANTKAQMHDFKSKAGSYKHDLDMQKKKVAKLEQSLAQMSKQSTSKHIAEQALNGSSAETARIIDNVRRESATPLCSICASPFGSIATVATKCGHIFHGHCMNSWFLSSKTCPKCHKASSKEQLLFVHLDSSNGGVRHTYDPSTVIDIFAKDKEMMNGRLIELQRDANFYQQKFNDLYLKHSKTESHFAVITFCLGMYREAATDLCETWGVDWPQSPQINIALENYTDFCTDHEAIASALGSVAKCVNGLWSQHCWGTCKKLILQLIGMAALFKWGPGTAKMPVAIAAVFAAGEMCNAFKLFQMKRTKIRN